MNKAIIMGRLTRDPETKQSQSGAKVSRFTVAVDRFGKDAGADFLNCVAFNKTAELAEKYLAKGRKVLVCGRIQLGEYTNRDGQKVKTTDIIVEQLEFCDKAPEKPQETPTDADGFMTVDPVEDEGLPFN